MWRRGDFVEAFSEYWNSLWRDIPHDVYVAMLILLCVGVLFLIGLYGLRKGLDYSFRLMFVEYAFLLYASTVIYRVAMSERMYNLTPFWSYRAIMERGESQLLPENIMNVLVFVPIGVLVGVAFRDMIWKKVLVIGFGLSLGIEVFQFVFRKGLTEVDDVMHNSLGCAIGFLIVAIIKGIWLLQKRYWMS